MKEENGQLKCELLDMEGKGKKQAVALSNSLALTAVVMSGGSWVVISTLLHMSELNIWPYHLCKS